MAASLTACSTQSASINPEALIPAALTQCQDAPDVPARPAANEPRTDDQKADYLVGLRGAFLDCKGVVHSVAVRRHELDLQAAGKPVDVAASPAATVTAQPAPAAAQIAPAPVAQAPLKKPWWKVW